MRPDDPSITRRDFVGGTWVGAGAARPGMASFRGHPGSACAKVQGQWLCKGDFFLNGSFRTGKLAPPAPAGSK